jgi:hypothetical protein
MFPSRLGWATGLLALMTLAGSGANVSADDATPDPALAKLGLKKAGAALMLEAESDVHGKTTAARQLFRDWSNAIMRQRSTVSEKEYQSTIKSLTDETNALRKELNTTNQMLNQIPSYRGRPATSYGFQQQYDLNVYKSQLNWEINERTTFLNQLKSQPFDPKAKLKIDAEVRDKGEELHTAVLELRKLVDETAEKYKELPKDDEVKKLLSALERKSAGAKLKVQASRQYQLDVKYLEKMEQQLSSGESTGATEKPARKGRRTTKSKKSTKAAAGAGSEYSGIPF